VSRRNKPISLEDRARALLGNIEFIYGDVTEHDSEIVRAMLVLSATDEQITKAIGIAAINTRVEREDKGRYAFGCLRNLLLEDPIGKEKA
jgi:hypothetical protein